ncbi:NUDIX hydrolase [Chitinimonas naiadis]
MSTDKLLEQIAQWRQRQPNAETGGLIRWTVEDLPAGWINREMANRLLESGLFLQIEGGLALNEELGGPISRSHALQCLAEVLHGEGLLNGWRGEAYDWLDDWGRARFSLERAAFRPLGLCSRAVHVNGYIEDGGLWLARRAEHKAVDPGLLDNLTAGGISSGETVGDCLVRELAEEAGIPAWLAGFARPVGMVRSRRLEADGLHDELLYCYDLALPPDFVPVNTDGEVSSFELVDPLTLGDRLDEMTWDAAAVTVDWLMRWIAGEV